MCLSLPICFGIRWSPYRSPGNTRKELQKKFKFYQTYGVEEYYLYRPDQEEPKEARLQGWQRQAQRLVPIDPMDGWISPRLGIRFEKPEGQELRLYRPDGDPFLSSVELAEQARRERQRSQRLAERLRSPDLAWAVDLIALTLDPFGVPLVDDTE